MHDTFTGTGNYALIIQGGAKHGQTIAYHQSQCSCFTGSWLLGCNRMNAGPPWCAYLQTQLLYHSIYGLVNVLLHSCIMLVPHKLLVLNDLQAQ